MARKKWKAGTPIEEVVGVPGELKVLGTYHGTRKYDGASYKMVVYTCGKYGGEVHFVGDHPRVRNCFVQDEAETLAQAERYWNIVKAFRNVAGIGILSEVEEVISRVT